MEEECKIAVGDRIIIKHPRSNFYRMTGTVTKIYKAQYSFSVYKWHVKATNDDNPRNPISTWANFAEVIEPYKDEQEEYLGEW